MHNLRPSEIKIGDEIIATFKTNPSSEIFGGVYLPLKVKEEYPKFFVCEVLPHKNPIRYYGISKPYPMSIKKFDLLCGDVIARRAV